jgi:hypothetical protein
LLSRPDGRHHFLVINLAEKRFRVHRLPAPSRAAAAKAAAAARKSTPRRATP